MSVSRSLPRKADMRSRKCGWLRRSSCSCPTGTSDGPRTPWPLSATITTFSRARWAATPERSANLKALDLKLLSLNGCPVTRNGTPAKGSCSLRCLDELAPRRTLRSVPSSFSMRRETAKESRPSLKGMMAQALPSIVRGICRARGAGVARRTNSTLHRSPVRTASTGPTSAPFHRTGSWTGTRSRMSRPQCRPRAFMRSQYSMAAATTNASYTTGLQSAKQ